MNRLITWHQSVGRVGLRLLLTHLLWLAWTLRGGVVLGIFPATAAVHAILRGDAVRSVRGHDPDTAPPLRAQFREAWHAEFGVANRLGALLAAAWAFLALDRRIVENVDLGTLGPILAGALTVAGIALAVITVNAWVLHAQFDDTALGVLRRATALSIARPGTLLATIAVITCACAYYLLPGLAPVLGITAPAALATTAIWRTGALHPPSATDDVESAPTASATTPTR